MSGWLYIDKINRLISSLLMMCRF